MRDTSKRLVIIEDDFLIATMMQDYARDLGWSVEGMAATADSALDLVKADHIAVALIDLNLGAASGIKVADVCRQEGIAVVFTTGYAEPEIPDIHAHAPLLIKPFQAHQLARALDKALANSDRTG